MICLDQAGGGDCKTVCCDFSRVQVFRFRCYFRLTSPFCVSPHIDCAQEIPFLESLLGLSAVDWRLCVSTPTRSLSISTRIYHALVYSESHFSKSLSTHPHTHPHPHTINRAHTTHIFTHDAPTRLYFPCRRRDGADFSTMRTLVLADNRYQFLAIHPSMGGVRVLIAPRNRLRDVPKSLVNLPSPFGSR